MKMLVFLKDPKTKPIISKLNPKMCLTCWQIFTDREKHDHQQSGGPGPNPLKHKITGTFQSMVQAQQVSILNLSRQWKKTQGVAGSPEETVERFELCKSLLDCQMQVENLQPATPKAPAAIINQESSASTALLAGNKRPRPALKELD